MTNFFFDVRTAHVLLALLGMFMTLIVMQLSAHRMIAGDEGECFRTIRRIGLALLGGGLGWSVYYAFERSWEPWPPFLLLLVGLDILLVATVVSVYARCRGRFHRFFPNAH